MSDSLLRTLPKIEAGKRMLLPGDGLLFDLMRKMNLLKILSHDTNLARTESWPIYGIEHEDPVSGDDWIEVELEDYRSA